MKKERKKMTEKEFLIWLANEGEGARIKSHFISEYRDESLLFEYSKGVFKNLGCVLNISEVIIYMKKYPKSFKTLSFLHKKTIYVWGITKGKHKNDEVLAESLGLKNYWMGNEIKTLQRKFKVTIEEVEE